MPAGGREIQSKNVLRKNQELTSWRVDWRHQLPTWGSATGFWIHHGSPKYNETPLVLAAKFGKHEALGVEEKTDRKSVV